VTTEEEQAQPATQGTVQHAQWSINLTTLITTGGAVGTLIVTLLIGGWFLLGQARAEGRAGGLEVAGPLVPRVSSLEQGRQFTDANVAEIGKDVRELYRVSPLVRSSPRLEAPPVIHGLDGGS
jgi:hypothetical protein